MKFEDFAKYAASGLGMLVGGGMVMGGLIDFAQDLEVASLVVAGIGSGLGVGGMRLMQHTRKVHKRRIDSKQERRIMQLAAVTNGQVTLTEVTIKLDMDVEEAKRHLDNLQTQGVFEYEVTENGALLYSLSNYNRALNRYDNPNFLN